MFMLAALAFLACLIFLPFVFFPSRTFAWFDRAENQNEELLLMQVRFAHVSKRLCVAPMFLSLLAGVYCVTQIPAERQRRLAQEQNLAERAEKTRKYSSTPVYTESQHRSRFEADQPK